MTFIASSSDQSVVSLPSPPILHVSHLRRSGPCNFDTGAKKDFARKTQGFVSMRPIPVRLMEKAHKETSMGTLIMKILAGCRAMGPYLLIELVLPGGTLIAILLWLYRSSRSGSTSGIGRGGRIGGCKWRIAPDVS
ncbi:MAG TPA: hypothetical protein VNZ02_14265 [Steroidobacteraceae bacterium]|jgi:hypothetical protein|nr:hypothetical protein [Steroidobacteraceae bacterium]